MGGGSILRHAFQGPMTPIDLAAFQEHCSLSDVDQALSRVSEQWIKVISQSNSQSVNYSVNGMVWCGLGVQQIYMVLLQS